MSSFTYRGYAASVFQAEDGFSGYVVGIRDDIVFDSKTLAHAKQRFIEAIEHYLAFCAAIGRSPSPPTAPC